MSEELQDVYVKIKDPSGSFHLVDDGQTVKIFRSRPAKLIRTERVTKALSDGVLVEISKKEYDNIVGQVEKTEELNQKLKDKDKDDLAKAVTTLLNDAIDLKVVEDRGSKGLYFNNRKIGSKLEEAQLKLVGTPTLRNEIQTYYVQAKAVADLKSQEKAKEKGDGADADAK